jgi:hypothetical protein
MLIRIEISNCKFQIQTPRACLPGTILGHANPFIVTQMDGAGQAAEFYAKKWR